jgi:uncharacterized protein YjiS (DUF1127 family)
MLNSSESANKIVQRYKAPSRELRFDLRDKRDVAAKEPTRTPLPDFADANSRPAGAPAMRADRKNTTYWSLMFTFFIEGFAPYGASLNAIGTSPVEPCPTEARPPQPEQISSRDQGKFMAIVSSNSEIAASKLERDTNRNRPESEAPSGNAGLAGVFGGPSLDTGPSNHRSWLIKPWSAIASRWAHWHREREIEKAVAALSEFDDRTLRDIGIPYRSGIEQVVRYCRDC